MTACVSARFENYFWRYLERYWVSAFTAFNGRLDGHDAATLGRTTPACFSGLFRHSQQDRHL